MSQEEPSEELLAKFKRNPVLENITEYLVEEASAEEEVLLGASADPISLDNGDKDNMADITFEKDDELNRVSPLEIILKRVYLVIHAHACFGSVPKSCKKEKLVHLMQFITTILHTYH